MFQQIKVFFRDFKVTDRQLGVLSCLSAVLFFFGAAISLDRKMAESAFVYSTFYFLVALTSYWLCLAFLLIRARHPDFLQLFKRSIVPILFGVLLCSLLFALVPPKFRMISDEPNLVAVSYSMAKDARADEIQGGLMERGEFRVLKRRIPIRPTFFPFLVQWAHRVMGYRPENAFFVNGVIFCVLLILCYDFIRKKAGSLTGLAAVFFVVAHPIIVLCATSSGFDLLHCLLLFISFLACKDFLATKDSLSFSFLFSTLLLLAHVRYEGFVCFFLCFILLVLFRQISLRLLLRGLLPVMLLFSLPILWQRCLTGSRLTPSWLQSEVERYGLFSFYHFWDSNVDFLKSVFLFNLALPYANAQFILVLTGVLCFLIVRVSSWLKSGGGLGAQGKLILPTVVLCNLTALWVIQTSWVMSRCSFPAASRFYVVTCFVSALITALLLKRILKRAFLVLLLASFCFAVYFPAAVKNDFLSRSQLTGEYNFAADIIRSRSDKNIVIVSRFNYAIFECGSVGFPYLKRNATTFLNALRQGMVGAILVVQKVSVPAGRVVSSMKLPSVFKLKPLAELRTGTRAITRISELGIS